MSKTPVDWNDPIYVWGSAENFIWSDAYRVVSDAYAGADDWYYSKKKKDLDKNLSIEQKQNFYNIVVKVNGLTKSFKNHKSEKIKITADHIHNTFREFGFDSKISIKAEIKKP